MNKLKLVQAGAEIITSIGVGLISQNAIDLVKPTNVNLFKKVCIGFGAMVLTDMVCSAAGEFISKEIEDVANSVKTLFKGNAPDATVDQEGEANGNSESASDQI